MNHFNFYSTLHYCSQFLGLAVALLTSTGAFLDASAIGAQPGWDLVWNDEFEGASLDSSKWVSIDWKTPHNNERQAYHPDQVTVSGGSLKLTAIDIPYGDKEYRSGKVESKWAKQYGRWEVRAKLPRTRGTWPAIWLLPDGHRYPWPTQGEIDIMEHRGDKPTMTSSAYHWGPNPRGRKFLTDKQKISTDGQLVDFTDSFHTYAVEWDAKKLRFFVDDKHHYTIHDADTGGFLGSQTAPARIQLNVAVGGDYVDEAQPNETSVWPQRMLVDYVRVYERAVTTPKKVSEGHLGNRNCAHNTADDATAW
jgi:beta-glucanase (GH16 family)